MSTLASYLGPELASQLPPANHLNPETHVTTMLGVEISLTILMVIFVSMRFYSRLFINGLFGLDDATMGLAAATAVGHTLVTCAGTAHGIGFHLWDVHPDSIPAGFKYTFTSILLFHPVSALTKMSVCLGYLRLFPGTGNLVFCWAAIAYSAMWGVASFFAVLFMCTPINLFWNQPFSIQRDCVDVLTLLVATAALNSLGDLLVYLWPIKFLFKLQMPLAHRLGLILLFSFGCVVFAASICRIVSLPPAMTSVDVLYNSSTLLLIASIEENVGIICGCLPCVKGTLAHFWPRIFRSTDHRSYSPDNTPNSIGGGGGRHNNSSSRRNRRDHYHHTGPGRVTGYGDHSHNHSATVVSVGGGGCGTTVTTSSGGSKGRKGSCAATEELELELGGWGVYGDERRLVGSRGAPADEESGIVMTQEVVVERSASVRGGGYAGRMGGYAGSSVGDLSTVGDEDDGGDGDDVEKGGGRSV
ncbi:hypothetical protein BK809_0006090 [Diplodia seriata]|uniref:Rhodopsin domain-containing protein n=1 Tax=Diplodia seriata TaxID=420778 RepID=A0A1S8B2I7_9PEZI|nr:hypothetical protein BK809_0006090 [Diplodia seriata]